MYPYIYIYILRIILASYINIRIYIFSIVTYYLLYPIVYNLSHTHNVHSGSAIPLTHPAQAVTAVHGARFVTAGSYPHDRSGFGQTCPDLGESKAVGVTESVASSLPDHSFWIKECIVCMRPPHT